MQFKTSTGLVTYHILASILTNAFQEHYREVTLVILFLVSKYAI